MQYTEAKEHTPGRLHELFSEPYHAFENDSEERLCHIRVMLHTLLSQAMQRHQVTLRVIHGWENGGCAPEDLQHIDYTLSSLDDFRAATQDFSKAVRQNAELPHDSSDDLLASPLDEAIAEAKAEGNEVAPGTREMPSRWPAFEGGLALYTLFKMYHRLVYGEDDTYRCSLCETPNGPREIHEFHLEEGEFALLTPLKGHLNDGPVLLVLHESQLEPIDALLEDSLPLFDTF